MEIPVRKILMGMDTARAANKDAMSNPQALDYFVKFRNDQNAYKL
jgi:acetoacetyl-CoA synthetase